MYVITGGAGFIGSNIAARLEADGRGPIVVCDRLGAAEKWRNVAKRTLYDIVPPEGLEAFLEGHAGKVEALIHMGAISATTETDADLIAETNFRLSSRLWNWCAAEGAAFVYASSAAVYGDGTGGFEDDNGADALAGLRPLNPYGWSKALFDRWVARRIAAGDPAPPTWAGIRFFNVYGPNEYAKGGMRSVAHQVFEQIRDTGRCRLFKSEHPDYPDGGQKRDFVWAGDAVDMAVWLVDGGANGIFNCGSGEARTFLDVAHAVFGAMGREPAVEFIDMPPGLGARYQYFTEASMDRVRQAGFNAPATPLEQGVGRYVREFLATDDPHL